ncbi:HemK2/MTQ2 family protein methyltransferase [Streptomyces sp. NPDC050856]|uniref:HemK2/MTQ2 family protein methyltransferase n=1 Tax=Streptomyces sp. NPDC050856 TaxID=3154939 RepID=UPI00340571B1
MLLRPWGVYGPQGDSFLLREALLRASVPPGARMLDVGTGTGLLALTAARLGACEVWAVDASYRAVLAARCNVRLSRLPVPVHVEHGDFRTLLVGRRFDVVTANPPYVPAPEDTTGEPRKTRAWNAGPEGRLYLDPLCAMAPGLLTPGGTMLLVHSSLAQPARTLRLLADAGLVVSVVARRDQPFGPVLTTRAGWLEERGLIGPGQREEELVVIRADRPPAPGRP